jgi:Fur family iron response transcriptional regulator
MRAGPRGPPLRPPRRRSRTTPGPDTALRRALRAAGLPPDGPEAALLALLRAAPETHLDAAAAQRLAAEGGLALARSEAAALLESLARAGLLGRLPVTEGPPVYDTVPEAHAHIVEEATGGVTDLEVSAETLLAVIGRLLADRPGRVEVLLRIRAPRPGEPGAPPPATRRGRPRRGSPRPGQDL